MTSRRTLITATVAAAAVGAGGVAAWWQRRAAVGIYPAPLWALRLARPGGGELVLADLRGKPLLVNFWATWCAPCIREMPELDRFHRDFAPRGINVVGLAIDELAAVREFLARIRVGFPVGLAGLDGARLSHQLGNAEGGLPYSVLIGAEGRVLQRKLGATTYAELAGWVRPV